MHRNEHFFIVTLLFFPIRYFEPPLSRTFSLIPRRSEIMGLHCSTFASVNVVNAKVFHGNVFKRKIQNQGSDTTKNNSHLMWYTTK